MARGPSGQWFSRASFESDAMRGSTELQHPELNYGPGISGELRVTHDSHQEPPDGWEHGWDVFFFLGGGGMVNSVPNLG